MKIIRSSPTKDGKIRLTIEVGSDEEIRSFKENSAYRLAYPLDDTIVYGRHIADAKRVSWCVIEQKWAYT